MTDGLEDLHGQKLRISFSRLRRIVEPPGLGATHAGPKHADGERDAP